MLSIHRSIRVLLLLSVALVLDSNVSAFDDVDSSKIRVALTPGVTSIMFKAPTTLSFTIYNDSDRDLLVELGGNNRNGLGRPDSFKVNVTDANGKPVSQPDAGPSFGGISWMQKIPPHENHEVKLYLPHWGTFESPGTYTISAARTVKAIYGPVEGALPDDQLTSIDVTAKGQIEVTPYDFETMGKLIEKLGGELLDRNSDLSESAMRDLSNIHDERIIPHLLKGVETKRYGIQFGSLRALGHYDDERAFAALQRGMQLSADDVENATRREVADQLAINLRHVSAVALSSSPHPEATQFLLSRRSDPSEAVRITILHVLGRMEPNDALPILREMANDKVERVSTEAQRYIDLLSQKH